MEGMVREIVDGMGFAIERRHKRHILIDLDEYETMLKAMNALYKEMVRAGRNYERAHMMECAEMIIRMYQEIKAEQAKEEEK